jgi:hypothetical protein
VAVGVAVLVGCHGSAAVRHDAGITQPDGPRDAAPSSTVVPWITQPLTLDGDWNELEWDDVAVSWKFVDEDGMLARPYSEVRLLRDQSVLYVGLYAGDDDIESTDLFQVTLGDINFQVHPNGHVLSSVPGIHAASDLDGTIDHPGDDDEEWVIEASVPLTLLSHPSSIPMTAQRCDVSRSNVLLCGRASATLAIAPASE